MLKISELVISGDGMTCNSSVTYFGPVLNKAATFSQNSNDLD